MIRRTHVTGASMWLGVFLLAALLVLWNASFSYIISYSRPTFGLSCLRGTILVSNTPSMGSGWMVQRQGPIWRHRPLDWIPYRVDSSNPSIVAFIIPIWTLLAGVAIPTLFLWRSRRRPGSREGFRPT